MPSTPQKKQMHFVWPWWRHVVLILSLIVVLAGSLITPSDAKSKRVSTSPVKISDVAISPDPFIIGKSPLTLTMLVELPSSLRGANVLEVSAMITSPTRRSMSFVAHRRSVDDQETTGKNLTVPVELVWDGKDQYHQLVVDGSYFYELQAKLMEDQGYGPRTKIVSHRVHGTLEALAYVGEVLPPLPPEPDIPEELEILREGESIEETVSGMEEGLKSSEDPVVSGEETILDVTDVLQPEEAGGAGSDGQVGELEEKRERGIPEMPEVQDSEFFKEPLPELPKPGEELPLAR